MNIVEFQKFLHTEIPITKQMGLVITNFDENRLCLSAPLNANINDKGSVFGGSSSALQIISAWSLIKLNCHKHSINADIVIFKNDTIWQKPMFEDFTITSSFETTAAFTEIKAQIHNHKKVSLNTISKAFDQNNDICSEMKARYVLIPK